MSSTKIINVLKDDSFAEIIALFKSTPASEVIFVLPKSSKAFQKEEHFVALREAADEYDKSASFLSSDSKVHDLAGQHDFEVLLARAPRPSLSKSKSASKSNSINVVNQIESFYQQPPIETQEEELPPEEEYSAPAAVATTSRRMAEVVYPEVEEQHNIKVNTIREKRFEVDVRAEPEIENVDEVAEPGLLFGRGKSARPRLAMPRKRRLIYTLGGAGIILAGLFIFMYTGSAQVTLKPATTDLKFNINVTASETTAAINTTQLALPGQTFTINKSVSQTFPATGSKDVAQKARGVITLSNTTSSAQPLITTTRFESSDGRVFRSLIAVTVPAAKSATVPGVVDVQVIADKAGSEYNIAATTFTIPAFKENGSAAKYQGITGKSSAAMHGGTSGKATVVSPEDFNKAKATLTDQLKEAIKQETEAETAGLKVVNNSEVVINEPTSTAMTDDAAESFTMTLSGTLKTAGFKESDLQQLFASYVNSKQNLDVVSEKLTVTYTDVKFDTTANELTMLVSVSGPGFAKVDEDKILKDLLGKKHGQIEQYLKAIPGLTSANVSLSPVWVRSVPKNPDRVHITVTR